MTTETCTSCRTTFAVGFMRCPRCKTIAPLFAGHVKEKDMPKITATDGPSNTNAVEGEVGFIGRAERKAAKVAAEVKAEVHAAESWAEKPLAHLREAAKERNLSAAGSKADLAARIAEHEAGQAAAADAPEAPAGKEASE